MATGSVNQQPSDLPAGRRWLPFIIMIAAFIGLMQYSRTPVVEPVMCERDIDAKAVDVLMLSASWCRYCRRARGYLVANDINYCEYDIEQSTRGAELYEQSRFGAIPVIFVGDKTFVGFNPAQITDALDASGMRSADTD